jgi:hypothetical protein
VADNSMKVVQKHVDVAKYVYIILAVFNPGLNTVKTPAVPDN